jgi:hypothetical protein
VKFYFIGIETFTVLKNWIFCMRFEVFRAMKICVVVFWLVASCSLVGKSQLFGRIYRPCVQSESWKQFVTLIYHATIYDYREGHRRPQGSLLALDHAKLRDVT